MKKAYISAINFVTKRKSAPQLEWKSFVFFEKKYKDWERKVEIGAQINSRLEKI